MSKTYQKTFPAGKNAGFTLIELLVVVLIIGILAAVALPQYQTAVEKSRATQALAILKSMGQAYQSYYMANGEYPQSFDELDVNLEGWTGHDTWHYAAAESISNGEWSLQLLKNVQGFDALYIGRLKGEYKGAGFGIFGYSPNGFDMGEILCMERSGAGLVYQKPAGSYCEKMFHATFRKSDASSRTYRMP